MINNVVIVSGVQQSDSVIPIHVSILFQILLPFRLLQDIEQSSLCYTVGPCWLPILYTAGVHVNPQLPNYPFPPPFPSVTVSSCSKSVSLFLTNVTFLLFVVVLCYKVTMAT